MEKAYVLISFGVGKIAEGVAFCRKIPGVLEVKATYGVWDAIATVEAETVSLIREKIIYPLREFDGLLGTVCLPIIPA